MNRHPRSVKSGSSSLGVASILFILVYGLGDGQSDRVRSSRNAREVEPRLDEDEGKDTVEQETVVGNREFVGLLSMASAMVNALMLEHPIPIFLLIVLPTRQVRVPLWP